MAAIVDTKLTLSRFCRKTPIEVTFLVKVHRNTTKLLFIPIIDHLVAELDLRFSLIQVSAVCGMYLIPKNTVEMTDGHRDNTFKFFEWSLPSPKHSTKN